MGYLRPVLKLVMKYRKQMLILFGNLVALLILIDANAQDTRGYIYGKVTTFSNEYQGQIRWGNEEAFWNDYFNANKIQDEYYESLEERYHKSKEFDWSDFDWNLSKIWEDNLGYVTHEFKCQFGDIKSLSDIGRDDFILTLKNGTEIHLRDGSNDFGATIDITDDEIGNVSVSWNRIEKVEFMRTPRNLEVKGGRPIYGTIETVRKGSFRGFIQWDHDERLADDKLDGDTRGEDLSLPFKQIEYIEKEHNGSLVRLYSGRSFHLTNSNDVDNDNRGIIVSDPEIGKIDIPWKYFKNATFEKAPNSGPGYDDFEAPRGIRGTVYTVDDEEHSGAILYDLDEAWEIETLDGFDDAIKYLIAFRNIKTIIPKNYAYSIVELRNGERLLLGESVDVSDRNGGLLISKRNMDEPVYIEWDKIAEISFD
jgi:hypothetical protein